jgi:hypothetical protein
MKRAAAVFRTRPETAVKDYGRVLRLAQYNQMMLCDVDPIAKLNFPWTKYFPAGSGQPWQVGDILQELIEDGYEHKRILPEDI